jgi:hypothetical protein
MPQSFRIFIAALKRCATQNRSGNGIQPLETDN